MGFRWFARETAKSLGLTGWVRNRPDGSVEGEAEGTGRAVKEFVSLLRTGPTFSQVDEVETTPAPSRGGSGFDIR